METLTIGHRGAKGHYPENTLISFEKALAIGAHGIEFDVHLSADGEVIVIHDETVNRTTNGTGAIKDMVSTQIKQLRIDHKYQIPLLPEVLDIAKNTLINIELKVAETAKPVVEVVKKYVAEKGARYEQFLISSFDWTALQTVRNLHEEIPIGVLTETDLDLAVNFAKFIKAETIHPHFHLLTKEKTAEIQQLGFKIFTWTVNEPEDIRYLKSFNVNAIITDFPERL